MPETVGQRLRTARESQKLTLEKAAAATRLRVHHLQALENDDYSIMASAAQGRGFLRLYADHLGLNFEQMIKEASLPATPAEPATPAPEAAPLSAPEAGQPVEQIIATSSTGSSRPGFWSRLTRRGAATESAPTIEATMTSTPEPVVEKPVELVEPIVASQITDPEAPTARKLRATKPRAPKVKTDEALSEADVIASDSDKKKLNLNQ